MKVSLIAHTPDPDYIAGMAAAICVGGDIYNVNECSKALKGALASGHVSVVEHTAFTFLVESSSRVNLAQHTRHRVASYSVESQRYVEGSGKSVIVPESIAANPKLAEAYMALVEHAAIFYEDCLEEGIDSEDARYGLLQGGTTRLIVTMNARELLHFFSLRCCNRAQWEIRRMADKMLRLVKPVAPIIFANAGPKCVTENKCPEGKKTCGKPRSKDEWAEGGFAV